MSCPSCRTEQAQFHQEDFPRVPRRYHETLASLAGDPDARVGVSAEAREAFFDGCGLAVEAEEAEHD